MKINWDEIREVQFPALKNNVYLKAAGGSPMSKASYESAIKYLNEMHLIGDNFWDEQFVTLNQSRRIIAEYLNCKPDEIAFLINTSSGMNVISRLVEKGQILYPSGEFPSSIHTFKEQGFDNIRVASRDNNTYLLSDFKKNLTTESKYLIHSHVQYLTGFKQDLNDLGEFCNQNDLVNIGNATQSFGAFPINVISSKIDMLVASGLKWACCGYGIGILYVKESIISENKLPFSSWLSVKDAYSMNNENSNIIQKTSSMDGLGGTPNFPAFSALNGGLNLIKEIGNGNIQMAVQEISNRIYALTSHFIEEASKLNLEIITPTDMKYRSGIITIESNQAERIYNKLLADNIYISLRNYPHLSDKTLLRFSFNYYNNFDDIERTISILKQTKE